MKDFLLLIPIAASFLVTLMVLPLWIKKAKEINLMWKDMNKFYDVKVAGSGGIAVILGFLIGIFTYISYKVFYLKSEDGNLVEIFALLTSLLLLGMIGFIDDLLGWQRGGLSKSARIVLVAMASLPLVVINAGKKVIAIPFIGNVDLGIFFPLVFIPIGIIGATTTYNFLAGFNGLEAGQGIILLSAAAIVAYLTGNSWLSVIAICMVFSLFAFLLFNFYPAKVFPGDVLTYAIGGLFAMISILGNFEKIALFFFMPYILETALKIRGKLKKYSFGRPTKEGYLELRYEKIYSLNHIAILLMQKAGIKVTEKRATLLIFAFQILVVVAGFLIFSEGLIK